jgi:two-component system, chemotaxis family, chemotaxis protein CheY
MSARPRVEPRILVVDDSKLVRRVLVLTCRQIPELLYATIHEAVDGLEALERLQDGGYDLILTDIKMPRLDGVELVRRVRQDLGDRDTPIVVVSTQGHDDDVQRGLDAGATAYLLKPLSPYRIRLALEKLLGGDAG